jgi:hypothetical protein
VRKTTITSCVTSLSHPCHIECHIGHTVVGVAPPTCPLNPDGVQILCQGKVFKLTFGNTSNCNGCARDSAAMVAVSCGARRPCNVCKRLIVVGIGPFDVHGVLCSRVHSCGPRGFPVALLGPLGCGVAAWVSMCSIAHVLLSRVTASSAVRATALERAMALVWAQVSLVASASATLACSVCRFHSPCGLPVSCGLSLWVGANAAHLGCSKLVGGACTTCGGQVCFPSMSISLSDAILDLWSWPLTVCAGGFALAAPPAPAALYSMGSCLWQFSGPPSADKMSLGCLGR